MYLHTPIMVKFNAFAVVFWSLILASTCSVTGAQTFDTTCSQTALAVTSSLNRSLTADFFPSFFGYGDDPSHVTHFSTLYLPTTMTLGCCDAANECGMSPTTVQTPCTWSVYSVVGFLDAPSYGAVNEIYARCVQGCGDGEPGASWNSSWNPVWFCCRVHALK